MELLLTFGSTHKALKAEEILKGASIPFKLLPAPKDLAAHCALVISVDSGLLDDARDVLSRSRANIKAVYAKEGGSYVKM